MIASRIQRVGLGLALSVPMVLSCAHAQPIPEDDESPDDAAAAPESPPTPTEGPREVAPGLRVDPAIGVVEFDAKVSPMIRGNVHGHDRFLLEQFVCLAGTKDHESLLVTTVKPSAIHAALIAAGGEPGKPVTWITEGDQVKVVPPEGSALKIEFVPAGGEPVDPRTWVVDVDTDTPMGANTGGWVFAGSTIKTSRGEEYYEADAAGTLIGLAGFGSETIAWTTPISDQEDEGELKWVAGPDATARVDEVVVVRVTIEKPAE